MYYGPVTALKFNNQYIYCGYGPILKIFEISHNQCNLITSCQIFKRNKIHHISICKDNNTILVVGARSFAIVRNSETSPSFEEKAVNEWITSAEFFTSNTILILTSHNTVYKIDVSDENNKFKLLERIHCNEKSILYSGSIRVSHDGANVLVAAGTVMDGTIIWDLNSRQIFHRLTDHKGSIFGVKIDEKLKYIISCSDDRSVKLYDFETGNFLAEGWGHGARIWNLEFFKGSEKLRILSAGEDCTARIWEYTEGSERLEQLEVIDDCHLGKHVWSCDLDDINHDISVTGGADGRIRVHDIKQADNVAKCISLESISEFVELSKGEIIKNLAELKALGLLFVMTSKGKLLCLKNNVWSLIQLEDSEKFIDFSLFTIIESAQTLIVTSIFGEMIMMKFTEESIQPVTQTWFDGLGKNKVNNVVVASNPDDTEFYLLLDCPNTRVPFYVKHFKLVNNELDLVEEFTLDQPLQPKFTSTDMIYDSINQWLIVYSRFVSIMVYDLKARTGKLFKKLCPGDTITSASVLENKPGMIHFLAVVRDGAYMYIKLTKGEEFELQITHMNKLTRGFIEGGFILNNDLILYGFRSNYFYVWNETKQLEIFKELCGGAHRLWDFQRTQNTYKFSYINKYKLYIKTFVDSHIQHGLINSGTHGREIRDIAVSPFKNTDGSQLIMSGSEDTVLRLGKLYDTGEIEYYWCMNSHISGLQKVKFLNEQFAASSAAMEEFVIWKLDLLSNGTPLISEFARLRPSSESPDLRVMDFDVIEVEGGFTVVTVYSDSNIKLWNFNIEQHKFDLVSKGFYTTCCLLSVNFIRFDNDLHILTSATDGHIAIWKIDGNKLGSPIIKQQLHQNSIKSLVLDPRSDSSYDLITGGDDNALILSNLSKDSNEIKWASLSFVADAASSTITALASPGDQKVVVASVDQIVRMWDYSDRTLECLSAKYTTVADLGCAETNGDMVILGGAGLSVWKF